MPLPEKQERNPISKFLVVDVLDEFLGQRLHLVLGVGVRCVVGVGERFVEAVGREVVEIVRVGLAVEEEALVEAVPDEEDLAELQLGGKSLEGLGCSVDGVLWRTDGAYRTSPRRGASCSRRWVPACS